MADELTYVQMNLEGVPESVKSGQSFVVSIRLTPQSDISVSAMPPVRIRSLSPAFKVNEVEVQVVDVRLNTDEPIRVTVQNLGEKIGMEKVQIEVQLSYCSEEEKWCRIGKKILEFELEVLTE